MLKYLWIALLALLVPLAFTGCGGGDGGSSDNGDSSGSDNFFVGEWNVTGSEGNYFITFGTDGSVIMADSQGGPAHLTGSYTVDGDTASGPLRNPGVGTAEFIAIKTGDNTMSYEFIEHWGPGKHIPLNGVRL